MSSFSSTGCSESCTSPRAQKLAPFPGHDLGAVGVTSHWVSEHLACLAQNDVAEVLMSRLRPETVLAVQRDLEASSFKFSEDVERVMAVPEISVPQPARCHSIDISELPDEVLLLIFRSLPLRDLVSSSRACKSWLNFARDPSAWRSRTAIVRNSHPLCAWPVHGLNVERANQMSATWIVEQCPNLAHVYLGKHLHDAHVLASLPLVSVSCGLTSASALVPSLRQPGRLRHLDIVDTVALDAHAATSLLRLSSLTSLTLCATSGALPVLAAVTTLRSLRLTCPADSPGLDDDEVVSLPPLAFPSLTELNVRGHSQLGTAGLKHFVCPRLRMLDVSMTSADDSTVVSLVALHPELRKLHLQGCRNIRPSTVAFIADHCPALRDLDVARTAVTARAFPTMPADLHRLSVSLDSFFRDTMRSECLAQLRARCRHLCSLVVDGVEEAACV